MSDSSSTAATAGGVSTLGLLGVVFVTLKLTHYIDWSWWYVTLPFWGGLALFLSVIVLIGLIVLLGILVTDWHRGRAR